MIDIGLLRTTLLETGNWSATWQRPDRSHPNSIVLKGSVFNYSGIPVYLGRD